MRKRRRRKIKGIYTRIALCILAIFAVLVLIKSSQARYVSSSQSNVDVNLAYYVVDEQSISQDLKLVDILPRTNAYTYSFSVSNFDGNDRTKTFLDYDISIKMTTNLPITIAIHKRGENTSVIDTVVEEQDDDGTYFRYITFEEATFGFTQNQTDIYDIDVTFPLSNNDAQYEGIIEYIQITLDARQKM